MSVECLAEMIAEIDKKPPVTNEEFGEAIAYWREREREMPHKRGDRLDLALILITRKEIENIISTKHNRDGRYARQIRGPGLERSRNTGEARTKGGEKFISPASKTATGGP